MFMHKKVFIIIALFLELFALTSKPRAQQTGEIFIDARNVEMVFVPEGYLTLGVPQHSLEILCEQLGEQDIERCVEIVHEDTGITSNPEVFVDAFWIDRYEVTIQQFSEFCSTVNNSILSECIELDADMMIDILQPQVGVSWYVASAYCNYRGSRLPTEIEWEYAASGPDNLIYPWGNTYRPEKVVHSQFDTTYPVGSVETNQSWVGAYDMSGNAAEWVENYFYTYGGQTIEPPQGTIGEHPASNLLERHRVVRGGSWEGRLWTLTTFWREYTTPFAENEFIGFRCARTHI